jgi:hypothetical protein
MYVIIFERTYKLTIIKTTTKTKTKIHSINKNKIKIFFFLNNFTSKKLITADSMR